MIDLEFKGYAPSVKNSLIGIANSIRPGERERKSNCKKEHLQREPEKHPNRILAKEGGVSYSQWYLYQEVLKYHECELNHFVDCNGSSRYVDVGIPELKLGFEYDGKYWHQDKEYDMLRDKELEEAGWKIIHITDNDNHVKIVAKIMEEML